MTNVDNGSATASRLRQAIDAGHTSGKIGAADPSAAPLGTDEEAAGTPIPNAAAHAALAYETGTIGKEGRGKVDPHHPSDTRRLPWALIGMIALIGVIVLAMVTAVMF
jgi:hypothetical protein